MIQTLSLAKEKMYVLGSLVDEMLQSTITEQEKSTWIAHNKQARSMDLGEH